MDSTNQIAPQMQAALCHISKIIVVTKFNLIWIDIILVL
jgi:hypothetical protein